jgi:hypothetical protein
MCPTKCNDLLASPHCYWPRLRLPMGSALIHILTSTSSSARADSTADRRCDPSYERTLPLWTPWTKDLISGTKAPLTTQASTPALTPRAAAFSGIPFDESLRTPRSSTFSVSLVGFEEITTPRLRLVKIFDTTHVTTRAHHQTVCTK